MKRLNVPLLLLPLAAVACAEQQSQPLPFDLAPTPVTRTVPASGGIVSTPAGVSVQFPAGAFGGEKSVTLSPEAVPAAVNASGRAISAHGFAVEPAGVRLGAAARAEVAFDRINSDSSWLASVVSVARGVVTEHGETRVDAATRIASAPLATLGTLAVVIPRREAIFPLGGTDVASTSNAPSAEALYRLAMADSLTVRCGGPARRCAGLSIRASDNLRQRVGRSAIVFPTLEGQIRIVNGEAVGSVNVVAPLRVELAGGQTAENVRISETFQFRARLGFVDAYPEISGDAGGGPEESTTLHIPETGNPSATVRYRIQIPSMSGEMESASITITFPFEVHSR